MCLRLHISSSGTQVQRPTVIYTDASTGLRTTHRLGAVIFLDSGIVDSPSMFLHVLWTLGDLDPRI